ncbi:tail fiber domain-containing protein [Spirosoma sp. BT702]|uniref:Tail fiber domain-containing protein n=1 Tax=Spirosoma profusum TaxID=2771354 RepID=A0A926XZJ8_9BACT|nr:tail fiber domain-containing protein [Spirosoma profusum]MBD2700758.1 tail fiber domain-containing protein [Spirosoma profusum]
MAQTRSELRIKFSDGKRPSGDDFAQLIDSFINPLEDNIKKDGNGNFIITLGNTNAGPAGTLRFTAQKVQFFDGTTWQDMGGGSGGGFQPVGATQNIAYNNGSVGIGTNNAQPAGKLEVVQGSGEFSKFGNAVAGNGAATSASAAQFSHFSFANNNAFALRQTVQGDVNLNAPDQKKLVLSHNGTLARLTITEKGNVVIGSNTDITATPLPTPGPADPAILPIFQVSGRAFKTSGGQTWEQPSDSRLKKDIQPFVDGLAKLLQINPVRFKYNGLAQTPTDTEEVGVLAQEIADVVPYTVSSFSAPLNPGEAPTDDLLMFNPSALTYVLINAVKELAAKVQQLEKALVAAE